MGVFLANELANGLGGEIRFSLTNCNNSTRGSTLKKKSVFGSDWSGVLNNNTQVIDGSRNSLLNPNRDAKGYLRVKPFTGALETLSSITRLGFSEIHIVSRVDPEFWIKERVRAWLRQHGFESVVPLSRLHFCEKWHEKAPLCERLGVTHFIDDRLEALEPMVGKIEHLLLFRPWTKEDKPRWHLVEDGKVVLVKSWTEVRKYLQTHSH